LWSHFATTIHVSINSKKRKKALFSQRAERRAFFILGKFTKKGGGKYEQQYFEGHLFNKTIYRLRLENAMFLSITA